jgi:hypothetical protein
VPACLECGAPTPVRNWGNNVRCYSCARVRTTAILKIHQIVYQARKRGVINKANCEVCGSEKSEAHHDDYAHPLIVRWLCRKHHKIHHSEFGPGANAVPSSINT